MALLSNVPQALQSKTKALLNAIEGVQRQGTDVHLIAVGTS